MTIDLRARLNRALAMDGRPSSDFDLNPKVILPEGRKLREAAVQILPVTFTAGASAGRIEREVKVATSLGRDVVPSIMLQVTVEPSAQADAQPRPGDSEAAQLTLP